MSQRHQPLMGALDELRRRSPKFYRSLLEAEPLIEFGLWIAASRSCDALPQYKLAKVARVDETAQRAFGKRPAPIS